ncbi:hypothetical protein XENOCAPTIV_002265 [Xenoophorus captivus]|uniref:Uncharacterized protein n=1 Tax=Xenoophorus captivus TaxID=1517983 RepID=A0ABV0QPG5_9TELE
MGKEQDLLVAVKNGDLLLAHKLLSKVKCNKTRSLKDFLMNSFSNGPCSLRSSFDELTETPICVMEVCRFFAVTFGLFLL